MMQAQLQFENGTVSFLFGVYFAMFGVDTACLMHVYVFMQVVFVFVFRPYEGEQLCVTVEEPEAWGRLLPMWGGILRPQRINTVAVPQGASTCMLIL